MAQPRYQWRYLVGWVHPASGRTCWHWASTVNLAVFAAELATFAQQVGAGSARQIALILDGAVWHNSAHLDVPTDVHLIPLPPYSPELQPAERLWRYSNARYSAPTLRIWRPWRKRRWRAVRPCRPTLRWLPPFRPPPAITGGLLTFLQRPNPIWYKSAPRQHKAEGRQYRDKEGTEGHRPHPRKALLATNIRLAG